MVKNDIKLILHNIRSVVNVGAIFRTAECAGVDKIYLTGYTPSPIDRFGRVRSDFQKASLGAHKNIKWVNANIFELIKDLKESGNYIVALEQDKKSVDYKSIQIKHNTTIILGNEVDGLPKSILSEVDVIAEIPIKRKKRISKCIGSIWYFYV